MAYPPQFVPPGSSAPSGQPRQPDAGDFQPTPYPGPGYPGTSYPVAADPGAGYTGTGYPGTGYPGAGYPVAPASYVIQPAPRAQRPAVIGMSASMTVTGTALWACALATAWLFAAAGEAQLQASQDFDGQVLILLNRFSDRLLDGLAVPLFGIPALAFVAAFLLLSGRRWAQLWYTLLGVVSVGWLVWWLHASPGWAVAPIAYIVIAVGIVWTPAAVRWFGRTRV